jgi:ANTAR domain
MAQHDGVDPDTEMALGVGAAVASVAEDHAVAVATARRARHDASLTRARAEHLRKEADEARRLAVSALAEADGLRTAMQSRSDIDMAKGILMAIHGVDPDGAFDLLRRESQRLHVRLVDVARGVLDAVVDGGYGEADVQARSSSNGRALTTRSGGTSHSSARSQP